MEGVAGFDPRFFEVSPLEAAHMDPQQRLLLMHAWAALEDAGYAPSTFEKKRVGVYTATAGLDYYSLQKTASKPPIPYTLPGVSAALFSGRLSAFFNWNGPSVSLDAACSGSLVAIVRAVHDLQEGRIDAALVGATNVLLDQGIFDALQAGHFLSPHFRCATFDGEADGYVRGEGVGCVLLRRLDDALDARDPCYGVIVSTAENHGGRAHSLTAPNPEAQKNLLLQAYQDRDLAARVSFVEAHGTGTKLGDPIEVDALKAAWAALGFSGVSGASGSPVHLGSVKTHIGHLEPAAGIASLMKVLLALTHKTLPGNLHFQKLNPYIDLGGTPFRVLGDTVSWESAFPRTAGISSFGFGGSNAHIVIEEAPNRGPRQGDPGGAPSYLIVVSAKSLKSLEASRRNLRAFLAEASDPMLPSIAYTLAVGRDSFRWRFAVCVSTVAELKAQLDGPAPMMSEAQPRGLYPGSPPRRNSVQSYTTDLNTWAEAYRQGYDLPWDRFYTHPTPDRIHLPTYPFDTQPYWFEESSMPDETPKTTAALHTVTPQGPGVFQIQILRNHPWFQDHVVGGHAMLPGVAHLALALEVSQDLGVSHQVCGISDVVWLQSILCEGASREFALTYNMDARGLRFCLQDDEGVYSRGLLDFQERCFPERPQRPHPLLGKQVFFKSAELYETFAQGGIEYGPFFRGIQSLTMTRHDLATASLVCDAWLDPLKTNLLDAAFQSVLGLSMADLSQPLLPFSLGHFSFNSSGASGVSYHTQSPGTFEVQAEKIS